MSMPPYLDILAFGVQYLATFLDQIGSLEGSGITRATFVTPWKFKRSMAFVIGSWTDRYTYEAVVIL